MPEPEPPIAAAINMIADAIEAHNVRQSQIVEALVKMKMAIKENTKGCWGQKPDMDGE